MNLRDELVEHATDKIMEKIGLLVAEAQAETVERLRRDLETPPPDVQEKVIKMLDLVSRDALKKADKQARDVVLRFLEQNLAEKRRADLLEAKCAEMTRDLQSVFNGDGEAMRAILARAGKPLFGPATTAQLAFLSVGALLLLAASEGNPGQLLLDRLAEAERLVRSYQKELSDARAFGVSKSGRLEKLERALRMMLNYHSVSETHGPNYQHECLACNAAREALAAREPTTVERCAEALRPWVLHGPHETILALSPDLDYIEREKLKARREERDVVGASLDHRPASLDGETWGFFIGVNDDRREELDRQLAGLPAVTRPGNQGGSMRLEQRNTKGSNWVRLFDAIVDFCKGYYRFKQKRKADRHSARESSSK